jgi:hypothetical protein
MLWKVKFRGEQSKTCWNIDLVGGSYGFDYLARTEGAVQGLSSMMWKNVSTSIPTRMATTSCLMQASGITFVLSQASCGQHLLKGFVRLQCTKLIFSLLGMQLTAMQFKIAHRDWYSIQMAHETNWVPSAESGIFWLNMCVYLPAALLLNRATVEDFLPLIMPI